MSKKSKGNAEEIDVIYPRPQALREFLKVSSVTAWKRERIDPDWPKPVAIGPRRIGYRLSDIRRYLDSRPAAPYANPDKAIAYAARKKGSK